MSVRFLLTPLTALLFIAMSFVFAHANVSTKERSKSAETVAITVHKGPAKDIEATRHALDRWLDAVSLGNSSVVSTLYTSDAVLLPTLDANVLYTPELRKNYFDFFTAKPNLKGVITNLSIQCVGKLCVASGLYTFEMGEDPASMHSVPARFSYVFENQNGKWMIIHHHSSSLPSAI